jgi:5-methyltetrahydrofolate--homocysteine methyltransferase
MKGMDEVGRLFNANQLIVAEVLQSAEAMKAAVSHLEHFMEKSETASRGKVLLATVKGDVHDIGKNLVEIILANNGFQVVNLGIKVPPEQLIQAVREHKPDMIGLSGLLVKSAQQMVTTAEDMTRAGAMPPMLVGGAALTENFVDKQIAAAYGGTVAYAKDAMSGLDLAKAIVDKEGFTRLKTRLETRRQKAPDMAPAPASTAPESDARSASIEILKNVPKATDFERHVIRNTPVDLIWSFINPMMLYGRHLGIRGGIVRELEKATPATLKKIAASDKKAADVWTAVQQVKDEYRGTEVLQPQSVYRFFHAGSRGNRVFVGYVEAGIEKIVSIDFPRQRKKDGLCLADYLLPVKSAEPKLSELPDSLGMFVTTVGKGVRQLAEGLKNRGDYLKSHILQALALESAEGYAELIHAQMRSQWGHPDPVELTMLERFQTRYRGKRYSFGYPACPRLDDQAILFACLKPEELGVQLTDGFMMDPEATVSALVFHHPKATYFSVGTRGEDETE